MSDAFENYMPPTSIAVDEHTGNLFVVCKEGATELAFAVTLEAMKGGKAFEMMATYFAELRRKMWQAKRGETVDGGWDRGCGEIVGPPTGTPLDVSKLKQEGVLDGPF